ncbi:hypothetical protein H9P43_005813 [Blastocladiella emersonii ATCC 22665]|nr:hypothetical protein H9P43_005813 [Blastocladiella emersonii ATCC 22665]
MCLSIEAKFHEHHVRSSSAPIMILSVCLILLIFARAGLSWYTHLKYSCAMADCPTSLYGDCASCQTIVTVAYVGIGVLALAALGLTLTLRAAPIASRRLLFIIVAILCFGAEIMALTCPGYCHTSNGDSLFRRHNSFAQACPGSAAAASIDALVHYWSTQISVSVYVVLAASTLRFWTAFRAAVLGIALVFLLGSIVDSSAASWVWLLGFNFADDALKSLFGLYQRELLSRATFYHNSAHRTATATGSTPAFAASARTEASMMLLHQHSHATSRASTNGTPTAVVATATTTQPYPIADTVTAGVALPAVTTRVHLSRLPSEDEVPASSQHLPIVINHPAAVTPARLGVASDSGGVIRVSMVNLGDLLTLPRAVHASLLSLNHSNAAGGIRRDDHPAAVVAGLSSTSTSALHQPKLKVSVGAFEGGTRYAVTTLGKSSGTDDDDRPFSPSFSDMPRLILAATTRDAADRESISNEAPGMETLQPPRPHSPELHATAASDGTAATSTTNETNSISDTASSTSTNASIRTGTSSGTGSAASSLAALGVSAPVIPQPPRPRPSTESGVLPPHRPLHNTWRYKAQRAEYVGGGNVRDSVVITSSILPALEPMGLDAALRPDEEHSASSSSMQGAPSGKAAADAARRQSRGTTASSASRRSTWYRRLRRALHRLRTEFFYRFPDPAEEERYLAYYYAKLKIRMQVTAVAGILTQLLIALFLKLSRAGRDAVNDAEADELHPLGGGMFAWLEPFRPILLQWWFPYAQHILAYLLQLAVARSRSAWFTGANLEWYAVGHCIVFVAGVVTVDIQVRVITSNYVLVQSACHQVLATVLGIATLRLRPRAHATVLAAFILLVVAEYALLLANGAATDTLAKIVIASSTSLISLVLSVYFELANRRYFVIKSHVQRTSTLRRRRDPSSAFH